MAGADELVAAGRTHAEQHLELEPVTREAARGDAAQRLDDQDLDVRRDPDVRARVEERVERREKAAPDLVGIVEGDRERLDVDALAVPDVVEPRDVGERPPQSPSSPPRSAAGRRGRRRPASILLCRGRRAGERAAAAPLGAPV
jgi:hypothetical protein